MCGGTAEVFRGVWDGQVSSNHSVLGQACLVEHSLIVGTSGQALNELLARSLV